MLGRGRSEVKNAKTALTRRRLLQFKSGGCQRIVLLTCTKRRMFTQMPMDAFFSLGVMQMIHAMKSGSLTEFGIKGQNLRQRLKDHFLQLEIFAAVISFPDPAMPVVA